MLLVSPLFLSLRPVSYKVSVKSPDGRLVLSIAADPSTQELSYHVQFDGQMVIVPSSLGLKLRGGAELGSHVKLLSTHGEDVNTKWKPVYGERAVIPDHYHQEVVAFQQTVSPFLKFNLIVRAYNEGVAFQYEIPKQAGASAVSIDGELTSFVFRDDGDAWVSPTAQGIYKQERVSQLSKGTERPLVVQLSENQYVAIGEADGVNYPRMKFNHSEAHKTGIVAVLGSRVEAELPLQTPWRFIMVGEKPGVLLEHNYLLENLNEPNQIKHSSWIIPGKVIRETTLTTQGSLACIDFAASHGLQYVEFDAGWYGKENSDTADATRVALDPERSVGPLDMPKVIRYADSKKIGIILYVNRLALERQLDTLLPLYQSWGIQGVKYGFVNVGTQQANTWLMAAIRKAAKYHLMVDVHDEYRPTGYSRTYPNFMSQEGVRGDEESPSNEQTVATVFTRMIAGAADHTVCYFGPRVAKMGSHVSQLAKTICIYSPWQFLFWYDKPVGSPGPQNEYTIQDVPELSFYKDLPTVWDDTKVLEGEIGKYATILRRSGDSFYIGAINGEESHTTNIPFSFLRPGKQYTATIYLDSSEAKGPTGVEIIKKIVSRNTSFSRMIKPNNGAVIVLRPVE